MPQQAGPLYRDGELAARPVLVVPYTADETGRMRPVIPDGCPCAEAGVGCDVGLHHRRHRKTGPTHPLWVMRCAVHDMAFTLYPPGFVPYARRVLVASDATGDVQHDAPAVLDAAMDAAAGRFWPRDSPADDDRRRTTQQRLVGLATASSGLAPGTDVDRFIATTAVVGIDLVDGHRELTGQAGLRGRGRAVRRVIGDRPDALQVMLVGGHLAGRWGPPWWWEPRSDRWHRLGRDPPILPTNSGRGRRRPSG